MGRSRSRARSRKPKLGYTTTPTDDDDDVEDFKDEIVDSPDGNIVKSEMVPINDDVEMETVENAIQAELNRIPSGGDIQALDQDEARFKQRAKRRSSFGSTPSVDPALMSRFASSKSRHRRRSSSRDRILDDSIKNHRVKVNANEKYMQEEYQQNMQFRRKMGYSDHPAPVPIRKHDEFVDEQSQYSDYIPKKMENVVIVHELKMNYRKKVFAFVVFLTVLASIGIILVVTHKDNNDLEVNAMDVPEPPSNIGEVCSAENVSTKDGRDKCKKVCQSASCCMASGKNSCFLQHENNCGMVRTTFTTYIVTCYHISY